MMRVGSRTALAMGGQSVKKESTIHQQEIQLAGLILQMSASKRQPTIMMCLELMRMRVQCCKTIMTRSLSTSRLVLGIGGGFTNTLELKVMKYHEAVNGPDGKAWKTKVKKEHNRRMASGISEPVQINDLPKGTKLINMMWVMKRKSNGTLHGQVNVRGFRQVDGEHYNGNGISAPVTNTMMKKMVLMLMLMQGGIAHVVNMKGGFLYGKF